MKKWRAFWVMIIVMTFCVIITKDTAAGALEKGKDERERIAQKYEALEMVNTVRSAMRLSALKTNMSLDQMAQRHCEYMNDVNVLTAEEINDSEYYSGVYPLDRSRFFEYDKKYVLEYNQRRRSSYSKCIEWCIQDPYFRVSLLSPAYTEIGFGKEENYFSIEVGGDGYSGDSMISVYPYAGQQGVGNFTVAQLSKIPDGIHLNAGQSVGIPVTIQYYNTDIQELTFENIRISFMDTRNQKEIESVWIAPQDENGISNTLIIFPKERYQANTGYTITVKMDIWYRGIVIDRVDEKWSFNSAGPESLGEVNRKQAIFSLAQALEMPVDEIDEERDPLFEYEDVEPSDEAYAVFYKLKKDGVLATKERVLNAESFSTREEVVVWLMDMLSEYAPYIIEQVEINYKDTFEDINQCSPKARDKVQIAYQLGLIEDQGRGIMNPKVHITQAEMNAIVEKVDKSIHISWPKKEEVETEKTEEFES